MDTKAVEALGRLHVNYVTYAVRYFVVAVLLMLVMVTLTTHRTEPGLGVGSIFAVCIAVACFGGFVFGIASELLKRKFLRNGGTPKKLVEFQSQRE